MTFSEFKRVKIGEFAWAWRTAACDDELDEGVVQEKSADNLKINGDWWHFMDVETAATQLANLESGDEVHLTSGDVLSVRKRHIGADTYFRLTKGGERFATYIDVLTAMYPLLEDVLKGGAKIVKK